MKTSGLIGSFEGPGLAVTCGVHVDQFPTLSTDRIEQKSFSGSANIGSTEKADQVFQSCRRVLWDLEVTDIKLVLGGLRVELKFPVFEREVGQIDDLSFTLIPLAILGWRRRLDLILSRLKLSRLPAEKISAYEDAGDGNQQVRQTGRGEWPDGWVG